MEFPSIVRRRVLAILVLCPALLAPRPGRAAALASYTAQVVARLGDRAGDVTLKDYLVVGQLNDSGQLVFVTAGDRGGALMQFSGGRLMPVALAGASSPDGKTWPVGAGFGSQNSMNQAGNVAFPASDSNGNLLGVYLWDSEAGSVIPIAVPGMRATNGLTFAPGGNIDNVTITDRGDVGFMSLVRGASGPDTEGAFVRHQDGTIQAIALPGDPLPGLGGHVASISDRPLINDAGLVAFDAWSTYDPSHRYSYLWQNGSVSLLADDGVEMPIVGKAAGAFIDEISDDNSVLVGVKAGAASSRGLFLWKHGLFTPVLVAGQAMPGGGTYTGNQFPPDWGYANAAGQYPFVTQVAGSGRTDTAAYVADAQGKLTLVLKTGMSTELGTVTSVSSRLTGGQSFGIGLNGTGQVALTARIDNGPDTILLLTPKAP